MELKEYIQNVIKQISEAITENNGKRGTNNTVLVNPALSDAQFFEGEQYAIDPQKHRIRITNVEFEVSLAISNNIKTGGRIGVTVLGANGSQKNEQNSSNKVKFTIPVLFPSTRIEYKV